MPRQFGPISRAPWKRASATSSRSRAAPSAPTSAKPAEITQTARVPPLERLLGHTDDRLRRDGQNRKVGRLGKLGRRGIALDTGDRLAAAVDRVRLAREAAGDDVSEELAPDRAASGRGAHDGDRARLEERPERGHDRGVVPLLAAGEVALGRRDREPNLHRASL